MLCKVCTNIFEGGSQAREYKLLSIGVEHSRTLRFTHHSTTRSLIESAGAHCYICTRVLRDALSRGFTRGPALSWQPDHSTSYVLQTLDRQTLSVASLELLISYSRERLGIDEDLGPDKAIFGPNQVVFWTKFILEPVKSNYAKEDLEDISEDQNTIESTGSEKVWLTASKWISNCVSYHEDCVQPGSLGKQLPTRLIKVGGPESSVVSLYEGNDFCFETNDLLNPINERYVTLSHCWGTAQILKLTKSTHERLKLGISDSELPRTFREAIAVTRHLRINYIWIDSLCIFQDSTGDWLKESSAMTRIYQQAYCNISALASLTSSGGCFRDRSSRVIKACMIAAQWTGLPKGIFNVYHKRLWQSDVAEAPLHQRAWVVQERLLAPRILHFGREQLFWECHSMNACETYPNGIPECLTLSDPSINFKGLNPSTDGEHLRALSHWDCSNPALNQLYIWEKVVSTYTSCALTIPQDKLIAISGIARRVKPLSLENIPGKEVQLASFKPAGYLAGLWDLFLPSQLLWKVKHGSRPSKYRAPSWSWASIDGQVSFREALNDGEDHIKIINCNTSRVSEDPFSQVNAGKIQLEGRPTLLDATRASKGDYYVVSTDNGSLGTLCRPDCISDQPSRYLYCLPIRTYRVTIEHVTSQRLGCLILAPTANRAEFTRCGQMTFENESEKMNIHRARSIYKRHFSEQDTKDGRYTMTII